MPYARSFALFALFGLLALTTSSAASEAEKKGSNPDVEIEFSSYHDALSKVATDVLTGMSNSPLHQADRGTVSPSAENDLGPTEVQVRWFADRFWKGREADLRQALARLRRLRPTLENILRAEGVPPELIVVVLIESGAQPTAQSLRKARGLWQLVPATARRYGLNVTPNIDERLDMERSARAAARYLRDLYFRFGDWSLALAAYNAGEEAVQRAIDRAGSVDFWELRRKRLLPKETRDYVPAVLAAVKLLGYPGALSGPARATEQNAESQAVRVVYALTAGGD